MKARGIDNKTGAISIAMLLLWMLSVHLWGGKMLLWGFAIGSVVILAFFAIMVLSFFFRSVFFLLDYK